MDTKPVDARAVDVALGVLHGIALGEPTAINAVGVLRLALQRGTQPARVMGWTFEQEGVLILEEPAGLSAASANAFKDQMAAVYGTRILIVPHGYRSPGGERVQAESLFAHCDVPNADLERIATALEAIAQHMPYRRDGRTGPG